MSVKISAMTAIGALAAEDLFEVVDDPSGTPLTRKATGQQVADLVSATMFTPGTAGNLLTDDGDGTLTSESGLTWDGSRLEVGGIIDIGSGNNLVFDADNDTYIVSDIDDVLRFYQGGQQAFNIAGANTNFVSTGTYAFSGDITTTGDLTLGDSLISPLRPSPQIKPAFKM